LALRFEGFKTSLAEEKTLKTNSKVWGKKRKISEFQQIPVEIRVISAILDCMDILVELK